MLLLLQFPTEVASGKAELAAPVAEDTLADVPASSNEAVQGCVGVLGVLQLFLLSWMECAVGRGCVRA